jgi:hypothetical protein
MKKILPLNYLLRIADWFWLGKYFVLAIAAVITTILYITKVWNYYPNILSAGLSLLGLFIILNQQMLDAKQYADHKPITVRNWLMSFPTNKPIKIFLESGIMTVSGGKAHLSVSLSENATIENKVEFLLKEVTHIQVQIANVDERIDDVASNLKRSSKELRSDLEKLDNSLKSIIKGHIVGDYDKNYFAITITICGTLIQLFYP